MRRERERGEREREREMARCSAGWARPTDVVGRPNDVCERADAPAGQSSARSRGIDRVGCAAEFDGGGEAQWPVVTVGHAGNPRLLSRARPYARSGPGRYELGHPGGARRGGGAGLRARSVAGPRTITTTREPPESWGLRVRRILPIQMKHLRPLATGYTVLRKIPYPS